MPSPPIRPLQLRARTQRPLTHRERSALGARRHFRRRPVTFAKGSWRRKYARRLTRRHKSPANRPGQAKPQASPKARRPGAYLPRRHPRHHHPLTRIRCPGLLRRLTGDRSRFERHLVARRERPLPNLRAKGRQSQTASSALVTHSAFGIGNLKPALLATIKGYRVRVPW